MRDNPALAFNDWAEMFSFNGLSYPLPMTTMGGDKEEWPDPSFAGYVQGLYRSNGIVFACMAVRELMFSEARFQFRQRRAGRPGDLFGTPELAPLESPWPNATTGDLLARAIQDADLAGNCYLARRPGGRLRRLRPDWVTIVLGSQTKSSEAAADIDLEPIGYAYHPGGRGLGKDPEVLLAEEVCHFAPSRDPAARFRGMSWLTPVVREVMGDKAASTHKLKFYENAATPNLAVKLDISDPKEFETWIELFERKFGEDRGRAFMEAYKTLYLGAGADVTVVGANMRQIDFKAVQGAGETRIAAAAQVPPVIVGLSEGLEAATYSCPHDQTIWTVHGPRPIGELKPGDHVWTWDGGKLTPRRVTWQGTTGVTVVYTLKTKNRTFRATGNHPVLMPGGSWRRVDELAAGDKVLEPCGFPDIGRDRLPTGELATAEAIRWLGAVVGDGCVDDGGVRMFIPKTDRVRSSYERIPVALFTKARFGQAQAPARRARDGYTEEMVALRRRGLSFREIKEEMGLALHPMSIRDRVYYATRTYEGEREPVAVREIRNGFRFCSKQAARWHRAMDVAGTAKTKRVPGWVFELTEELRLQFLAGIVDTDGSVGKDGRLAIGFANRGLVEDVRMLLVSCGIQCSNVARCEYRADVLPNIGRSAHYESWRFVVSSARDVARIPFTDALYRERVNAHTHRHRPNKSRQFRIVSIERGPAEAVYDIEVDGGGNTFLADGVVVHNSNYQLAMRRFADLTMRPLWRNMAGSLATVINVPQGAELWYDDRDIPALKEDVQVAAGVVQTQAATIAGLVKEGFTPESAKDAVISGDLSRLVHTGLVSVQLQPPGTQNPATNGQVSEQDAQAALPAAN